ALLAPARFAAIAAFIAMAASGFILFAAEASHLAVNPVFRLKLVLICAGLTNLAIYELCAHRLIAHLPAGAPMPPRARAAGFLSLAIWIAVAACGRAIAYF
ncbi:MAG: hypothetical protein JO008_01015, partial [Alphaproteobacteria bacterium]|nr:hypothetical protein [Alphaproteobacteria bacterium]